MPIVAFTVKKGDNFILTSFRERFKPCLYRVPSEDKHKNNPKTDNNKQT